MRPMPNLPGARFLDARTPPHIATLILVAGVPALAMNVFLPSLPAMAEHFGTDYGVMQLSVSIYLGMNAVMQVIVGPISDRYGRRPVLTFAFAAFALATLGCVLAPNVGTFLFFRALQAAAATGMVLSRAIVRDLVPQAQAASMIGYVTMGMSVVPMIGPVIGGWLDEGYGWQAGFWLQFALGLGLIALIRRDLGETAPMSGSFAQQVATWPQLLHAPRYWGYVAVAAFSSGAFFSYLGGAPFVGSEVFGLSAGRLGLYFGAPAVGYFLGNWISGRFSVAVGVNRMILMGTVLTLAGLLASLALSLGGLRSPEVFFAFMCFVGLGNGMVLPNAMAGQLSVVPHLAGTAAGLGGATMLGGGALLSAVAGMLLGPGSSEVVLLVLMSGVSAMALAMILWISSLPQARAEAAQPAE